MGVVSRTEVNFCVSVPTRIRDKLSVISDTFNLASDFAKDGISAKKTTEMANLKISKLLQKILC